MRTYRSWTSSGSGTNTVYFPTTPVEVQRTDRAGSYDEFLTFAYTPGTNTTPLGTESITASNIKSLTRDHYTRASSIQLQRVAAVSEAVG